MKLYKKTICTMFTTAALVAWLAGVAAAETVTINQPKVNIRSGPGTNFSKISEAAGGTKFDVLGAEGDWLKISLPDGKEGWVYSPLVDREVGDDTFFLVTVSRANLRKGPSTSEALMGSVTKGTSLPVVSVRGQWVQVSWEGKNVWISATLGTQKRLDPADLDVGSPARSATVAEATALRSGNYASASVVANLKAGTSLKYLDGREGWLKVEVNGKTGWVDATKVNVFNQVAFAKSVNYGISAGSWSIKQYPIGKVTGTYVNLRTGPGTTYKKTGQLSGGQQFKILETRSGWYRISSDKGQSGWISSSYATVVSKPGLTSVTVKADSPQRKQVVIEGSFTQPVVKQVNDGMSLAIWAKTTGGSPSKIDANMYDIGTISANENGVRLDFSQKTNVRIAQAAPGKVVAVVETVVTGASIRKEGTRDIVSVATLGYAEPVVRAQAYGKGLELVIPGAVLSGEASGKGQIVTGIRATANGEGVIVSIDTPAWRRHVARKSQDGVDVTFLEPSLKGKTIVLDPGHGGSDPGAIGLKGLYEKVPNLKIALALKPMLEKAGAKVVLTRSDDTAPTAPGNGQAEDLAMRVAMVDSCGADLFLSIHNNANTDRSKSGTTMYYAASSFNAEAARAFSETMQAELVAALGRVDNGVRKAEHYVSRTCPVPAAIAEVVFISNPEEEALLATDKFCKTAATGLFNGLKKFYSE